MFFKSKHDFKLPDGRSVCLEYGHLAKQADGAVLLTVGKTMLLATVTVDTNPAEQVDFLPLHVDYQEKFSSVGKIPGGFTKREGKLSDHEILVSRLIDRSVRPLFPDNYFCPTQIVVTLISGDLDVMTESMATFAASTALLISRNVPFNEPVAQVRVGRVQGEIAFDPLVSSMKFSDLDVVVSGNENGVIMVEGEMAEISEEIVIQIIKDAHKYLADQCAIQRQFLNMVSVVKENNLLSPDKNSIISDDHSLAINSEIIALSNLGIKDKRSRKLKIKEIYKKYKSLYENQDSASFDYSFELIERAAMRYCILKNNLRLDGRECTDVRDIECQIDYVPSAHGSALFTRGSTQSLTTVTLGNKHDEQVIDSALFEGANKFMLHYNFPGFCTGEVKPSRGSSRREIGHGNLALRALKKALLPSATEIYTVRVVSDILESDGSSSMATVCAGSMALMDAGVHMSGGVSGIAMGLICEGNEFAILSDISGDEDALGDMDFKVAGTLVGITACQMDIKVKGLSYEILAKALNQAKQGRLHILNKMNKTISEHNDSNKSHAPQVRKLTIPKKFIGGIIGPGGRIIQDMQKTYGLNISIEEKDGVGIVTIFSNNKESADEVENLIKGMTKEPELNEVYNGKVKTITDFGAFVEFLPGKEGLLHISEVKWGDRIDDLSAVLTKGEEIQVKLIGIDGEKGKYRLSRKVLLDKEA